MQSIFSQQSVGQNGSHERFEFLGKKIGFFASLFGCWHEKLSRPVTIGKVSYRSCLICGARKPFDVKTFQSQSKFYSQSAVSEVSLNK